MTSKHWTHKSTSEKQRLKEVKAPAENHTMGSEPSLGEQMKADPHHHPLTPQKELQQKLLNTHFQC